MPDEKAPRLEGAPPKLYLVIDGVPWRIHDADFRAFKALQRPLGASRAQSRYFVSKVGVRRVYQFKKTDDHGLEVATLARQLSSAGWVAKDRFEAGKVTPT